MGALRAEYVESNLVETRLWEKEKGQDGGRRKEEDVVVVEGLEWSSRGERVAGEY